MREYTNEPTAAASPAGVAEEETRTRWTTRVRVTPVIGAVLAFVIAPAVQPLAGDLARAAEATSPADPPRG